jgi:hypothetical protein
MFHFWLVPLLCCCLYACARSGPESAAGAGQPEPADAAGPDAVLRAGEFPLWFQLSETGPVLLDHIEDARFSAALVPWPLAPHISFMLAGDDELLMAINRGGFVRFSPWGESAPGAGGTGMYYVSGGELWRQYTVGAFVFWGEQPAALLYRDDRFLDSGAELPRRRMWTFGPGSAGPEGLDVPALDVFPPGAGWSVDALRLGADGFWYFRAVKPGEAEPEIRLLRTAELGQPGETVSVGRFQNAALPWPLDAAPPPLGDLLKAAFAGTGGDFALVLSPAFQERRFFGEQSSTGPGLLAYYRNGAAGSPPFLVAALPDGRGIYLAAGESRLFSLPPLPAGFVYTGIGMAGGRDAVLFASWEEQEEYSIGAAGFMVIQMPTAQ